MKLNYAARVWTRFIVRAGGAGLLIGAVVYAFFKLLALASALIWDVLPEAFGLAPSGPVWGVGACLAGGLCCGLIQKKWPARVIPANGAIRSVRKNGVYPGEDSGACLFSAIAPIAFGAPVGPEAGLTVTLAAFAAWFSKHRPRRPMTPQNTWLFSLLAIGSGLAATFSSPLFGIFDVFEPESAADDTFHEHVMTRPMVSLYVITTFFAYAVYRALALLLPVGGPGMPFFTPGRVFGGAEYAVLLPGAALIALFPAGAAALSGPLARLFARVASPVARGLIGGAVNALVFLTVPLALFTGEDQSFYLAGHYTLYSAGMLFLICALKLVLFFTNCAAGLAGGSILPGVFAGTAAGYALALAVPGLEPVFCVAVGTGAVLGALLKKPLAVSMLLLTFFPARCVVCTLTAALIGNLVMNGVQKALKLA